MTDILLTRFSIEYVQTLDWIFGYSKGRKISEINQLLVALSTAYIFLKTILTAGVCSTNKIPFPSTKFTIIMCSGLLAVIKMCHAGYYLAYTQKLL